MNTTRNLLVTLGVISAASVGVGLAARTRMSSQHALGSRIPVLVELFTSEGCSSCPSADQLLAKFQQDQPESGALIVPLSEHVDYFNSSSWQDRFSSAQFTERQSAYVRPLHSEGIYTPEMVVDGEREFVGNDEDAAEKAIMSAAKRPKATIEIGTHASGGGSYSVDVSLDRLPVASSQDSGDVYLAVTENNLTSQVKGGENEGRQLRHTAVVRSLLKVGTVSPGAPFRGQSSVKLSSSWKKADLSIVSFVQLRNSRRIVAVGIADL